MYGASRSMDVKHVRSEKPREEYWRPLICHAIEEC